MWNYKPTSYKHTKRTDIIKELKKKHKKKQNMFLDVILKAFNWAGSFDTGRKVYPEFRTPWQQKWSPLPLYFFEVHTHLQLEVLGCMTWATLPLLSLTNMHIMDWTYKKK